MTLRSAERIIGRPIQIEQIGAHQFAARSGGVTADGSTEAIAIDMLLKQNYKLISQIVFEEQEWKCAACGKIKPLEIDHIIPRARGRLDTRGNLRALCSSCHRARHGERTRIS